MSGIAKITVKGVEYPLRFGVRGLMKYEERVRLEGVSEDQDINIITGSINVVYAGLYSASIRLEKPAMSFADASDLFDELSLETDYNEQLSAVWDAFNESVMPIITARNPQPEEDKKKVQKKSKPKS